MEHPNDNGEKAVRGIRSGTVTSLKLLYAGLIVHVMVAPSGYCNTEMRSLTYDQIYNSTHYAQLEQYTRPLRPPSDDTRAHKLASMLDTSGQLLVGFARDPYRQSIPAGDYDRGVRSLDPQLYSNNGDRGKRGVVHLYNMLTCATGCDPLDYKGYGCYCGFLGEGRPTDGIDNCCRIHDECYDRFHCPFYTVYFQPYYWKCYHGEPLCALENHLGSRKGVNSCAGQLCECDRRFAMCVQRYSCPRGKALCRTSPLRLLQNILMSYK